MPAKNVNVRLLLIRSTVAAVTILIAWILFSKLQTRSQLDVVRGKGEKVNVTILYETLCPDSRHFILKQLYPAWQKVPEIMNLEFRPFGKAHYYKRSLDKPGYTFSCQHGPKECQGNMVHACSLKYVKEPFPYIKCMMEDNYEAYERGRICADQLNIDFEPIMKCATSLEGEELLAEVGAESLGVKHYLSFIPTIVMDGSFNNQNEILKNFLSQICNAYKGDRPENCIEVI